MHSQYHPHPMPRTFTAVALAAVLALAACRQVGLAPAEPDRDAVRLDPGDMARTDRVVVRHVLVAHRDANIAGVTRTLDEAETIARRVLAEAQQGRDFTELVRLYSDERTREGRLTIANWGVTPAGDEMARDRIAPGFARVAFDLPVGGIGIVPHHVRESPYGWHVVLRLE